MKDKIIETVWIASDRDSATNVFLSKPHFLRSIYLAGDNCGGFSLPNLHNSNEFVEPVECVIITKQDYEDLMKGQKNE
jgi:hypothetical protein